MNKKSVLITSLIAFSGLLTLGTMSHAFALFTKPAENASFGISQATDYYLKGSFNSWGQENTYKFVNNTAGMTAEANKIKEYKLENIPLNKDDELKIWSSVDAWYKDGANNCTYEHHWSNEISFSNDEDHNYIVPMTSKTYSFYLKFYNDGSSKVFVTANKDILYFVPSSNWTQANAEFAILQYTEENQDNVAHQADPSEENPSGTFKFELDTTYPKYKFARLNPGNGQLWNTSNMQTIGNSDTNNCFQLWDNYYDGGAIWNGWNPVGGTESGVSTGVWSAK